MSEILQHFYLRQEEPHRSCLLALRQIILSQDTHMHETIKYGMPCFIHRKKIICYLWTDKKTGDPYILMADGRLIDDAALEQGDRARMKILRIDSKSDLPVKDIKRILRKALEI